MKQNLLTESNEYSRIFAEFLGVDFASDPARVDPSRLPYAVNMWKDYGSENAGFVETIPGFRKLVSDTFDAGTSSKNNKKEVYGLSKLGAYTFVHKGDGLYRFRGDNWGQYLDRIGDEENKTITLPQNPSTSFCFNEKLYILTGGTIFELVQKYNSGYSFYVHPIEKNAYEPTVYQNYKQYEQPNLLTDYAWEEITSGGEEITDCADDYKYRFRLMEDCAVQELSVDGNTITDYTTDSSGGYSVCMKEQYTGNTVRIRVKRNSNSFDTGKGYASFFEGNKEYPGTGPQAINGCTIACQFDGRIFLTGNAELPNTVFYAGRDNTGYINPTYFGVLNYFNTGAGSTRNTAMVSSYTSLLVLKGASDEEGTVHAYTGADTGEDLIPRIYTRTEGLPGVGCVGRAVNFLDDIVFLSKNGLEAIGKQTLTMERNIEHRSSNVDPVLTKQSLRNAVLTEWLGYLCVSVGGKMFLADSRRTFTHHTGTRQYEWWYLDGIGTYENYRDRYRTVTSLPPIEGLPDDILAAAEERYVDSSDTNIHKGTIKAQTTEEGTTEDGTAYWYVEEKDEQGNTAKYLVDCVDDEQEGYGEFYPATAFMEQDGNLYFGTGNGDICVFNTDKRGVGMPTDLSDKFPPEAYTFAGAAYPSEFATCRDNAGYPHVTKTTINSSLVVKFKKLAVQSVDIQVSTDRKTMHPISPKGNHTTSLVSSEFDAGNIDLGNVGLGDGNIIPFKEKEKKWVEKQFFFRSDAFERPFGVSYLAYRFRVAGKIK